MLGDELDQPLHRAAATAARLHRKLGLAALRRPITHDGMSFDDQLAVFEMLYPQGFTAGGWIADKRGEGAKRRLKRHRDAAIADARERLDVGRMDERISADDIDAAVAVARGCPVLAAGGSVEVAEAIDM